MTGLEEGQIVWLKARDISPRVGRDVALVKLTEWGEGKPSIPVRVRDEANETLDISMALEIPHLENS
jgi:hypothetical protein